jgi:hypothetical protein
MEEEEEEEEQEEEKEGEEKEEDEKDKQFVIATDIGIMQRLYTVYTYIIASAESRPTCTHVAPRKK